MCYECSILAVTNAPSFSACRTLEHFGSRLSLRYGSAIRLSQVLNRIAVQKLSGSWCRNQRNQLLWAQRSLTRLKEDFPSVFQVKAFLGGLSARLWSLKSGLAQVSSTWGGSRFGEALWKHKSAHYVRVQIITSFQRKRWAGDWHQSTCPRNICLEIRCPWNNVEFSPLKSLGETEHSWFSFLAALTQPFYFKADRNHLTGCFRDDE